MPFTAADDEFFADKKDWFLRYRGGDRPAFYDYCLGCDRKFITRMNQRDLWSWKAGSPASEEARGCKRGSDLRTQPAVLSRQLSPEAAGRAAEGRR